MIKQNLETILSKLPSGVQLVAVSKFHPVERLMEAYNAGQRIFGENRPQELATKVPQMPADVQWHFIGHLQTNKLKLVLPYASLVQSVDSLHLLEAINAWGAANNKVIDVLLELHLGAEETKQGFSEEEIISLCKLWEGSCHSERSEESVSITDPSSPLAPQDDKLRFVCIRGLMGMATNTEDMDVVEKDFIRIESLYNKISSFGLPAFDILSIGMSGDWPVAVKHGATMVRIGTDIFGPREY